MPTRVLVVYHSVHGHVEALARAVVAGAESVRATDVRIRQVPTSGCVDRGRGVAEDATADDLRWADGIAWGTPTRYGTMATPVKQFLDGLVELWKRGELEDKPTGVFTSSATIHGGQESTILTTHVPLLHFGMIVIGTPYVQNPQIFTADAVGGSPYGPSTLAGPNDERAVPAADLCTARNLGIRLARVASALKIVRVTTCQGVEVDTRAYDGEPAIQGV